MTNENSTPQPSRRTVLKAASAAGIIWAAPTLHSSTVHAASTCVSVQFNDIFGAETTTDSADDGWLTEMECAGLDDCSPTGTGSLCTCASWALMSPAPASPGTWLGLTYTPPSGCTVVAANARAFATGSGCPLRWPCIDPSSISTDSVVFPGLPAGWEYKKFRIMLCCTT